LQKDRVIESTPVDADKPCGKIKERVEEENRMMNVIEVQLPPQQYEQLTAVAQARQLPVAEVAQAAVTEWLERQAQVVRVLLSCLEPGSIDTPGVTRRSKPHTD
jgi:acetolactate synthase small subunit